MTNKAQAAAVMGASAIGAAAALGAANKADALYHMFLGDDVLSNIATMPASTTGGFSISGANGFGTTWAYGSRSAGTITANITSAGGSMYARAFARCWSPFNGGIYSAVYSEDTWDSTSKSVSCSWLPSGNGPWSLAGWGVSVLSSASIPNRFRNICDGQACATHDYRRVSTGFLNGYPALAPGKTLVGGWPGVSVPGPSSVMVASW